MAAYRPQEVNVGYWEPHQMTREIAAGVAIVACDAYADRFSTIPREIIATWQSADVTNPTHVDQTLYLLGHGPERGWYWSLATHESVGYTAVLGFGLTIVRNDEIFLAELHTHPDAQRLGLAKAMAKSAILAASRDPAFAGRDANGTQVMLNVARQRPQDDTEHPAAMYRKWSFSRVGPGDDTAIGDVVLATDRMRAPLDIVLTALEPASRST